MSEWSLQPSASRALGVLRRAPLRVAAVTALWLAARGSGLFVVASFVPAAQAAPRPALPGDLFASQPPEVQTALRFVCSSAFLVLLWTIAAWADAGFLRVLRDVSRSQASFSWRPFLRPEGAFGRMLAYHVASGLFVFAACLVAVLPGAILAAIPDDPASPWAVVGTALALGPMAVVYLVLHARLLFAPHGVALEGLGARDAMRRSFERTRGGSWRLLVFVLALELVEAASAFGLLFHWVIALLTLTLAHAFAALVVLDRWGASAPATR